MRELVFLGDTQKRLREFPDKVRGGIGYALGLAQIGEMPYQAKPFKGYPGVIEIVEPFNGDTYRAVYAYKLGSNLYVLHVFQKKSVQGIKTPRPDLELIDARYKTAKRKAEFHV